MQHKLNIIKLYAKKEHYDSQISPRLLTRNFTLLSREAEGRKEVIHLLTHLLKAVQNPRGTKHCPRPSGDNSKVSQGDGLVLTSPCLPFLPHTEGI